MLPRNPFPISAPAVIVGFVLLNAAFLAFMPLLPFIDLPNHLAEAVIYQEHDNPANDLRAYYMPVPWYFPNSFHALFCALFPSVETGNKVFHMLYIALLHGGLLLVIRELKGNAWYGLLAILFTYNYNVTYGFVGFVISIPMLIILFYLILADLRRNQFLPKFLIALTLVLLFFMHAQNALLGLTLYCGTMLYAYRLEIFKHAKSLLLTTAPLIVLTFTWWYNRGPDESGSTQAYLANYYTSTWFETFGMRARLAVFDNFQLLDGWPGVVIALLFFLCLLIPIGIMRPWERRAYSADMRRDLSRAFVFFLISFLCYTFLPDKLPGQTPLFQRFCTIVILAFLILASVWIGSECPRWLRVFVITVATVYTGFWVEYIWAFNQENRGFNPSFFSDTDRSGILAGLIYDNEYRGRKVYIHFPNYFIVWNEGVSTTKIIDYRFGIVRRPSPASPIPFYHELIGENYRYQPQYEPIDLFLTRGNAPVRNDRHLHDFSLIRAVGAWRLYARTAGTVPSD